MAACTFFGHSDCPEMIAPYLIEILKGLVANYGVDMFYVGNHGRFDATVHSSLQKLKDIFPKIEYAVVLAYMPNEKGSNDTNFINTLLPEGIERIPRRFAIAWRNEWMLRQSEFVVTYITHSWGGAARFAEMATKQKKTVFNIAKLFDCEIG